MPDHYFFRLGHKSYHLVRTCQGRWSNIAGCHIPTDGEIPDRDGLVYDAEPLTNEDVANLIAKLAKAKVRRSKKEKLKIRRSGLESTLELVSAFEKEGDCLN